MAELPEIAQLAGQMRDTLRGKTIRAVALLQEKCANIPPDEFQRRAAGAAVIDVTNKGKWIVTALDNGELLLLSLGMGADVLYFENEADEPEKYQVKVLFTDGSGYTARFWWFGKFLLIAERDLDTEPNTAGIALDPFDAGFTPEHFAALLAGKKTQIKALLMNQKIVGGIGNMYMHDILWGAGLHPQRKVSDLSADEVGRLYGSIAKVLNLSRGLGTFAYESDFFGRKGGYGMEHFQVGYKENQLCPACGAGIVTVKACGSTTFICPACQRL